jgi:hypothetical protein
VVLPLCPVDQAVAGASAVAGDQQPAPLPLRDLRDRLVQDGDQIGGGVTARVARTQQQSGQLAGVVDPTPQRGGGRRSS